MFIYLLVHNLSELFTLPLLPIPAPLPEEPCAHSVGGVSSGPRPQRLTQHGGAVLNPTSCRSYPKSGVSPGLCELHVCSSLPLLKGTYRSISCYTIALDGQAIRPRALAQINRVWN